MEIMMMAAGGGKRFRDDGYKMPKPFIPVRQRQMWEHVALKQGLDRYEASLVIRRGTENWLHMDEWSPITNLIQIPDMVDRGPAWSVVAATLNLKGSESVLLIDCDCFVDTGGEKLQARIEIETLTAKRKAGEELPTAIVVGSTAPGNQLNAAAIRRTDETTYVIVEPTESNRGAEDGELINVGTYWFNNLDMFRSVVHSLSSETGREIKLSDVYNAWPEKRGVLPLPGRFHNLGTPEDLRHYTK